MPQTLTDKIVEAIIKSTSGYLCLDEIEVFTLSELIRTAIDKVIGEQVKIDEQNLNGFKAYLTGYFSNDKGKVDDIITGFNLAFDNPPKPADDGK